MVWHITVLKVSIKLFVPVLCGTLQFPKFDTIMCACKVPHSNVNYLWHYDVAQSSFKSCNTFI